MSNSVSISENMNKKKVYVDPKNMLKIKKDISNQINMIEKSLNKLGTLLNKAVYKKNVKGNDLGTFVELSKKCNVQSEYSEKLLMTFESKLSNDINGVTIKGLDDRIKELEKQISAFLKDK